MGTAFKSPGPPPLNSWYPLKHHHKVFQNYFLQGTLVTNVATLHKNINDFFNILG